MTEQIGTRTWNCIFDWLATLCELEELGIESMVNDLPLSSSPGSNQLKLVAAISTLLTPLLQC